MTEPTTAAGPPMPDVQRVSPPFTNRSQELAQAFREAVAMAHEHGTKVPVWRGLEHKPSHPNVEDADYNCSNQWCQRFWAMVREAEDTAIAIPPEAIGWAKELVRQGYRDEHVVTFTEDGYGLEHPIRCRPDLIGCVLNEWLQSQPAPDRDPGRYVMLWSKSGPKYTAVRP